MTAIAEYPSVEYQTPLALAPPPGVEACDWTGAHSDVITTVDALRSRYPKIPPADLAALLTDTAEQLRVQDIPEEVPAARAEQRATLETAAEEHRANREAWVGIQMGDLPVREARATAAESALATTWSSHQPDGTLHEPEEAFDAPSDVVAIQLAIIAEKARKSVDQRLAADAAKAERPVVDPQVEDTWLEYQRAYRLWLRLRAKSIRLAGKLDDRTKEVTMGHETFVIPSSGKALRRAQRYTRTRDKADAALRRANAAFNLIDHYENLPTSEAVPHVERRNRFPLYIPLRGWVNAPWFGKRRLRPDLSDETDHKRRQALEAEYDARQG